MKKAVALISAGMDSVTSAWIAKYELGYDLIALHFSYGQMTQKKEREYFDKITDTLGVERKLVIELDVFKKIGGFALLSNKEHINDKFEDGIPASYVSFRNGIFFSIATSLAEAAEASAIITGVTQVDYSGYPDCRGEFLQAMEKAINSGTRDKTNISIIAPVLHLSKSDTIRKGMSLNVPFELTWSCYTNDDEACGVCDSCRLRLKAFEEVGIKDPIPYKLHNGGNE